MRALLSVLIAVACALADDSENRRSKLPYIADAVGNTLPPPSNVPATVGSPVNLLTPDRYEFYTFDESGELVKRLMTLEEIQAIVAAGEETEGLVTFANENQPTIAFNFSQPPYTKVHNVVTNVQNVLKAQMEAHKNKPLTQPTFDTPDVSDSWSLILPSIFGNTGVDIIPDKTSGTFTTPETETIELDNSLSKEGSHHIPSTTSTPVKEEVKEVPTVVIERFSSTTEKVKAEPTMSTPTTTTLKYTTTTTTTTTTAKPLFKITTPKSTTTTVKSTITSAKPTTSKPTTVKLRTTTSTTSRPRTTSTTGKPKTTTTIKPTTKTIQTTSSNPTTTKPISSTKKTSTTYKDEGNFTRVQIQTQSNTASTTAKTTIQYEKISTFVPLSTATFITERSTQKPVQTTRQSVSNTTKRNVPSTTTRAPLSSTKAPLTTAKVVSTTAKVSLNPTTTTHKPSKTTPDAELDKFNATTITTQSVSPSTTISSTEYVLIGHHSTTEKQTVQITDNKQNIPDLPMFDISESFSQIASDLGNYRPLPTTSDLLETTKLNEMDLESKENVEIDIPVENENKPETVSEIKNQTADNFIKISTLEPQSQIDRDKNKTAINLNTEKNMTSTTISIIDTTTSTPLTTTIDPVLSESMDDLLSQIVNQAAPSIVSPENRPNKIQTSTTEIPIPTTKVESITEESASTTAAIKADIPAKLKEPVEELKNMTNEIPQIFVENRITNTNESDDKPKHKNENVMVTESPKKEELSPKKEELPPKKEELRQNLVKISEPNMKKEEKPAVTEPNVIKENDNVKKQQAENIHKIDAENKKSEDKNDSSKKAEDKPTENIKKQTEQVKPKTTTTTSTTTTEIPQKSEEIKKPLAGLIESVKKPSIPDKKPETTLSNANKIVTTETNKVLNNKDKNTEEQSFPKVEEFKKKFQKVNIDDKELANERNNSWKLISTVAPPKANEIPKDKLKTDGQDNIDHKDIVLEFSKENQGLEVTTKDLGEDIAQFTELCNELAFRYWHAMTESIDKKRSFVLSPYSITSMLAMMFMGARGATSGEMNDILKLDDMVTFNPHFTLKNISDSIETTPASGVIVSAFVRELFSDRSKGKILTFYKERAQHFYSGHVEEINFKLISDIIRRRTNLLVKRYTWGRIVEYMKANTISMQPPLAAFSANIFQTDCSGSSVEGRDGEMYFVVSPNVRQRRLVPVPAVVYRSGFLAGYDPVLDATAAALGNTNSIISTLFLMPGQQGNIVHADDLEALEKRLLDTNPTTPTWNRLLRTLLPRMGLELQIPRFSHKSLFNVSTTLKKMGLKELFDPEHADLGGLNGPSKDLYLSDMIQSTTFVTCGEGVVGEQHHIEEYPENLPGPQRRRTSRWATGWEEPRDYQRAFHDPHDVGDAMNLPLHLRPRQARLPARNAQPARLKFDRPFLYFVRHNPSGMILYVGRYNPRLLP